MCGEASEVGTAPGIFAPVRPVAKAVPFLMLAHREVPVPLQAYYKTAVTTRSY
jgi:hypothetical protein